MTVYAITLKHLDGKDVFYFSQDNTGSIKGTKRGIIHDKIVRGLRDAPPV